MDGQSVLTPSLIVALGGLLTIILVEGARMLASKQAIKKDEVDMLRDEVARLQNDKKEANKSCEEWRQRYDNLYNEYLDCKSYANWMEFLMKKRGLEIPTIPKKFNLKEKMK